MLKRLAAREPAPALALDPGKSCCRLRPVRAVSVIARTVIVEFFCYRRTGPALRRCSDELLEERWFYMDRYQAQMIARGAFPRDEPNCQAGVYLAVPPGRPGGTS